MSHRDVFLDINHSAAETGRDRMEALLPVALHDAHPPLIWLLGPLGLLLGLPMLVTNLLPSCQAGYMLEGAYSVFPSRAAHFQDCILASNGSTPDCQSAMVISSRW
ncbi:hypothetical protein BOTBODRAFT_470761 [Botryobasidium botryosum FD-172 SS1]|uniref:Uncharacterized protein n=1 Tax=Botryobasidium botryosum (strain FD-172 SS1) TaxID=930990 RepID=A0A067MG72_BOTB1|nr:hypothetical protein BOTBODRAFT_470761 [Botryobasidium botryosum FD-172 SS1]